MNTEKRAELKEKVKKLRALLKKLFEVMFTVAVVTAESQKINQKSHDYV